MTWRTPPVEHLAKELADANYSGGGVWSPPGVLKRGRAPEYSDLVKEAFRIQAAAQLAGGTSKTTRSKRKRKLL